MWLDDEFSSTSNDDRKINMNESKSSKSEQNGTLDDSDLETTLDVT